MWIYDTVTLAFLKVNQAACIKYGYTEAEFHGFDILHLRPEAYRKDFLQIREDLHKTEYQTGLHTVHMTKAGVTFCVNLLSFQINYEGVSARFVQAVDVEDYYAERIKNAGLVQALEAKIKMLHKLAWSQSHELRGKIANLKSILELWEMGHLRSSDIGNVMIMVKQELENADDIVIRTVKEITSERNALTPGLRLFV